MLQLKKGVENASNLGEELGRVLGTAATASALLHTSTIEIKDLDECATKEEVTAALDALLGVPVSKRDPVKSLRKVYAGTQVAVVAFPDDLAATALKLSHVRIGWVNCRIRAREEAARCYRCWSPGHLELPSGPEDHPGPSMMRILQLNLNHCEAAQDLLCDTISRLRIDVAILCEQYKNLAPPNTWLADADGQAAIWVHGGIPVQERPARVHPYFAWARIGEIFFFSVYAPSRLSEREFSALLANITEEARGRRPLVIAGDFNAWSTEWGCRETRPRASILLDSLALFDAVLLNTGDVPTFNGRQGSSIVDLTFVGETLTPRVLSWTVSGLYTHSDHRPSSSRSRTTGLRAGPRRAGATGGTPVLSMWTVSLPSCPAHRSLPGPRKTWRRASCPSSPAHVMPRCPRQILAAVVNRCIGGRPRSLISGALACGLADSSRDRGAGMTKKPTARTTPQQGFFCAWRSRPANDARRPSSPAPLSWCAARWRLCFRGCRAGPPCSCRVEQRSLYRPSPWRNSKELSRGSRSAPRLARMAYPTQRSRSLLPHYPTSSCGCIRCLETGVFPSSCKRQRLVLLPKPGKPPDEPSSYRPLCMLDTAGKILERIICDRLEAFTERPGGLSERQYGFRKGRSTIDAIEDVISTAREAIAGKRWYHGTKKYCAVVTLDVRNAFNSARWDNILAALRRLLVPDYLLRIIANYFSARVLDLLDFTTDEGSRVLRSHSRRVPQGFSTGPDPVERLHNGCETEADRTRSDALLITYKRLTTNGGSAHHKQEKSGNHHHHGRRLQHTLVPLHPLPGPAHRRQAEVRRPSPNSQRKGSRCDRCPCEDHAQLWRAQKLPTQAVCSRRRLHTPVRSPRLEHSSTNASLHTTGGVSPPTSLPACDRRPAACRLRGRICPCRHTTAGPSRG
ncbi:unnamed protein product [Trichogramma brassicae]|uniref:Reverse transcriptase domain-containing protein n=1 Tax=Trichogramma brassicae TaxID=86971 RepID=A0A6H5IYD2_9HYME|nr:unnamed protein product [Trichogramma brassicae]